MKRRNSEHLNALVKLIRNTKHGGRHDGLGNPIISLDIYQESALKAADEVERIRNMIDQTADGVLLPDCEKLFCPHCTNEVDRDFDWFLAACNTCMNPDTGQAESTERLPLAFTSCYSTKKAAEMAKKKAI